MVQSVERFELRAAGGAQTVLLYGDGALDVALDEICPWLKGRTAFFLSSEPILGHQGDRLRELRSAAGRDVSLRAVDGEAAKDGLGPAAALWQEMIASGGKRDSRLVTFGGGSIGDLGGFLAACFLRGIEYIQIPTTLLAQVDAAIGGKTAVDVGGKNTVGAFHHPRWVVGDSRVLATLPAGELRAGLVESVKMAALLDTDLFRRFERDLDRLLAADPGVLGPVVAASARAKVQVVSQDPKEKGLRRVLNFGHTFAHALEKQLDYRHLRHGEAVAYGLLFVVRLARELNFLEDDLDRRLRRLLIRFDLPELPMRELRAGSDRDVTEQLVAWMQRDKKATEEGIRWCMPRGLGSFDLDVVAPLDRVGDLIRRFLADPWAEPV
ncbi:MAG: 3-dehydroquinate synthase [Thermoanaerobaculia bacterium]|nr:3-dehydroquinate synthase [Thermoanaerobaculia bacterium]